MAEYMGFVLLGLLLLGGVFFAISLNYRLRHDNDRMSYLFAAYGFTVHSIMCFIIASFSDEGSLFLSLRDIRITGWILLAVAIFDVWLAMDNRDLNKDKIS